MADKTIVADAGPLIAFGRTKRLSLLSETLGKIIAPQIVLNECLSNITLPGAKEISAAIKKKLIIPHENTDIIQYKHLLDILGSGEAMALSLVSKLKVGILIDEKLGRQTAQKMNLRIIGTAGVLLLAKEKKIIQKVAPLIQELKNSGYYLSEGLIKMILLRARES